jgi:hydrogenase maturation protease
MVPPTVGVAGEGPSSSDEVPTRIGVLGLGSVLRADDAIGPYVVRVLDSAYRFPDVVRLLDLGTPGPELAHYVGDFDVVIVIDTAMTEGPPGHVAVLRREAILAAGPSLRVSPHDPGLREALLTTELEGKGPADVVLIGVVPASVELETGLSEEVRSALPRIREAVLDELQRLGITPEVCQSPATPDIWWER